MSSPLSERYAFIENRVSLPIDEDGNNNVSDDEDDDDDKTSSSDII